MGSHLARVAIGVTDTVMVGWYSVDALAGLIIATALQFILFMLGSGYAIGLMGVLSNALARFDEAQVRRATRMALWLSVGHSLAIMPLLWWSEPILLMLKQDPVVAAYAQDYLRIAGWGVLFTLCGMVMNSYLAAMERAQVLLWITVAGIPVNILVNWVLIFGNLGMPELGVKGAAIASVSVQAVQIAAMFAYAAWLPKARHINLFQRFWRPDWAAMLEVFRIGMPVGITVVAEVGMFTGTNILMGWLGVVPLAAHGIAMQIASIAFMFHLGLSNAATIRVGSAQGRGDAEAMRDVSVTALMIASIFALLVVILFLAVPDTLVEAYLDTTKENAAEILALAAFLLIWAAAFQLADAVQAIALGMLRGVQDTRVPMLFAGFSYWVVGLPSGYLLAFHFDYGPGGLWAGLTIGLVVAAILLLWRFWRGLHRGDWTRGALKS